MSRKTDLVHAAALKAAAKVAFSMALLEGCSSPGALGGGAASSDDEAVTNESAIATGSPSASSPKPTRSLGKKPCPSTEDAGPAKAGCDVTLAATFPTPGPYQWEPVAQSKEVVACCDEELAKNGAGSNYRWDCCVAFDPDANPNGQGLGSESHGLACTPWGPPVPPSMGRARRPGANAELAAWLAKVVA
ncbi:MAG: hypothetical protein K0S65_1452 [Labilithrix sp.]|nr:hypothetical protein [Labilithrix sp.]